MTDSTFAIQISYKENYLDANNVVQSRTKVIVLDAVSEPQSTYTNTITDHPIVSGDMVADHAYKNPMNLSFSGSAALKGHTGVIIDNNKVTPANVADAFVSIKDNAYLCDIVKISVLNEKDIRFSRHTNMVLTSITITEKINTIDYQLQWRQVLLAEVQTADVDISDEFLPNVTEPKTTSFTDALIDWNQVDVAVMQQLVSFELFEEELGEYISTLGQAALSAIIATTALAVFGGTAAITAVASAISVIVPSIIGIFSAGAATAVAGVLAATPAGWIVLAAAAVGFLVYGIVKLFDGIFKRANFRVEQFKKYLSDKKTQKEVERFCNFLGEIHKHLEQLNNVIHVYQIGSDEDQECMLSISNNYYIFTFTTNNVSGSKKTRICTIKGIDSEKEPIKVVQDVSTSPSNFNACTTSNYLFRAAESGSYVYLIALPTGQEFKLSDCLIVVSDINPEEYNQELSKLIKNALTR